MFWNAVTHFPICTFYQDKMYRRYIYISGTVDYETGSIWEILRYNLDTDTWISVNKTLAKREYSGLTTQFQGSLLQIHQSYNQNSGILDNLEITEINQENYDQKLLLEQKSADYDLNKAESGQVTGTLGLEDVHYYTVSLFHTRKYL